MSILGISYYSRFGLEHDPFLKNSKDVFIENAEAREVLKRLEYLQSSNGFGILTGEPGLGKTTCVRNWANSLNRSLFKVVYSSLSTLTVKEFYAHLSRQMGIEPGYYKSENFKKLQDEILRLALDKRITPVIIIDEANHINTGILNDLKMIFNFDMDSRDRAIVLLVGQRQINSTLSLNTFEALRQRIVMNYNMEGLSKKDGREYIIKKLESAGCTSQVFDEPAIEAILNNSFGKPRVINRLCTASMIIADSHEENLVSADIAMKAFNDTQLG